MSEIFCILPWIHLSTTPKGLVRLCCMANGYISKDDLPMALYNYPIDQIWNSEHMRSIRRGMTEGKEIPECQACYHMEKNGLGSFRNYMNNEWKKIIGPFDELLSLSYHNNFYIFSSPNYYHLITGNLCNLKCRMCSSWLSSQVERDSVHDKWSKLLNLGEPELMIWKNGTNSIAPEKKLGIDQKGFYNLEHLKGRSLRWTTGKASISFTMPKNMKFDNLSLKLPEFHPENHHLKIKLNNDYLFKGKMPEGPFSRRFDISNMTLNDQISLRLESDTFRPTNGIRQKFRALGIKLLNRWMTAFILFLADKLLQTSPSSGSTIINSQNLGIAVDRITNKSHGMLKIKWVKTFVITCIRLFGNMVIKIKSASESENFDLRKLGIAVEKLELSGVKSGSIIEQPNNHGLSFQPEEPWHQQKSAILKEIIKNPLELLELHFSGGEPMIHNTVEEIINHLIDKGATEKILLRFNTNCTIVSDRMVEKLRKFNKLNLALSIDAYSQYYEYIRYPGKWNSIGPNIEKLKTLKNAQIVLAPVLQVYNALNIVELLKYSMNLELGYQITLLTTPWFLNISILPEKIRQLSAKRIRDYAEENTDNYWKDYLTNIANSISKLQDNCTEEALRNLMLFTNDLDATRKQSFRETHEELLSMLEENGFHWTDEKKYA